MGVDYFLFRDDLEDEVFSGDFPEVFPEAFPEDFPDVFPEVFPDAFPEAFPEARRRRFESAIALCIFALRAFPSDFTT